MKAKTMVLMGVAIVCGLAASYMTSRLINERDATVKVLTAKTDLKQWTPVREPAALFEEKDVPRNQVPPTYIQPNAIGEMKNRPLIKNVKEGQVITWEDLQKDRFGLEFEMPAGKRAFAIEASARTAVAGFVLPGSHVDLILVKRGQGGDAEYVLEDVLVRAIDLTERRPPDVPGLVPSTVTVEITPAEVLKLSKVVTQGQLMLSLRPFDDRSKSADALAAAKPPPPPPPPIGNGVDPTLPPPIETAPRAVYQTGFDGSKWVRYMYTIDAQGNVIGGPVPVPINETNVDVSPVEPSLSPRQQSGL